MKKLVRLFTAALMLLAVTSCEKDNPPVDAPSLEISPSNAIVFTAPATESVEITVTTNQSVWNAVSDQAWCIITKADGKFTVTAAPNTATTPPAPATITVSAGDAQPRTIAVTQAAATESYPTTEEELKEAISKVWVLPATSDYISLEFGAQDTYTLLSKKQFAKADDAQTFLTEGTYTVENDLKTLVLSGFGTIVIKSFTEVATLDITPTGETTTQLTMAPQKIEDKPTTTDKRIHQWKMGETDENTFEYTGDKLTLVTMKGTDDDDAPTTISIPIKHDKSTVSYEVDGTLFGKPGTFKVTYALNSAGLATSSTIENNGLLATIRYTYNASRELILWQQYNPAGKLESYCNAVWTDGNVTAVYYTDTQDITANYKMNYLYTEQLNKGGFMLPMAMPVIFESSDFFDYIGQWAGVLGKSCKNLITQHASGDGDFAFILDSEGYPTLLNVYYLAAPEDNWSVTITYK